SELGREEDSRLACRASAGGALAGREYDLRAARSPWPGGSAPVAPAGAAWRLAAGGVRGGQRCLGRGFQGMVSHGRRPALRSVELERSAQPLRLAAASHEPPGWAACLAGARRRLPRVRLAARGAQRQWCAVRRPRRGWLVA